MRMKPVLTALVLLLLCSSRAFSAEIDCLKCHRKLAKNKVVHPAVGMGCMTCHAALDARTVPHKKTNAMSHGLSSEQPELCYACHDKAPFTRMNVHPAVSMGCTSCHNPHSSTSAKLLKAKLPALCFTCHDKAPFARKAAHAPVADGMCLTCHIPHASDEMALLTKKPENVCLECHPDIAHGQHFPAKPGKPRRDPTRPDKPFYCGSCHNPHGSDFRLMFRFGARTETELCIHCHKM